MPRRSGRRRTAAPPRSRRIDAAAGDGNARGLLARSFTERFEGQPLTANVALEAKLALLNDLAHARAAGR